MSAGVCRNAVCGPGCAETVALSDDDMSGAGRRADKEIAAVPDYRVFGRHGSAPPTGHYERDHGNRRRCRFVAKYLFCASRSASDNSGSRQLSGSIRISAFDALSAAGPLAPPALSSHQCALVFNQKICAVMLPALAAANRDPEIIALASATPQSSSARRRLRKVLGVQPTIRAI